MSNTWPSERETGVCTALPLTGYVALDALWTLSSSAVKWGRQSPPRNAVATLWGLHTQHRSSAQGILTLANSRCWVTIRCCRLKSKQQTHACRRRVPSSRLSWLVNRQPVLSVCSIPELSRWEHPDTWAHPLSGLRGLSVKSRWAPWPTCTCLKFNQDFSEVCSGQLGDSQGLRTSREGLQPMGSTELSHSSPKAASSRCKYLAAPPRAVWAAPGPSALVGYSPCPDKVPWPPPPPAATLSQALGINSLLLQTFHTPSAFHSLGEKIKVSYSAKEFLKPMLHFDRYKNLLNVWCLTSHFLQQDFLSLSSVFLVFSPQTKS